VLANGVYDLERRQAKGEGSGLREAWRGLDAIRGQLASAVALRGLVQATGQEPERAWALLEAAARLETEAEAWGGAWDDAMQWPRGGGR
jgi:hypothetical protein